MDSVQNNVRPNPFSPKKWRPKIEFVCVYGYPTLLIVVSTKACLSVLPLIQFDQKYILKNWLINIISFKSFASTNKNY